MLQYKREVCNTSLSLAIIVLKIVLPNQKINVTLCNYIHPKKTHCPDDLKEKDE